MEPTFDAMVEKARLGLAEAFVFLIGADNLSVTLLCLVTETFFLIAFSCVSGMVFYYKFDDLKNSLLFDLSD